MSSLLPILALVATAAAPPPQNPLQSSLEGELHVVTALDPLNAIYDASASAYDGVARLRITKSDGTYLCTGSLIGGAASHVVTAAHCLAGESASSVDVVLDIHDLTGDRAEG